MTISNALIISLVLVNTQSPARTPRPPRPADAAAILPTDSREDGDDPVLDALEPVPGGLTADSVAAAAVAVSPEIELETAALMRAAARVDETIAGFLPQMSLSASYNRLSYVRVLFGEGALVGAANPGLLSVGPCPDGTGQCVVDSGGTPVGAANFQIPQVLNNFSTTASISVPVSDYVLRIFIGIKAAKLGKQAAQLQKQARISKVTADAKVAYYNWLRAVAGVAVAKDAVLTASARHDEAQTSFRAGVVSKVDLLRVEALVAQARSAQVEAEAFESVARRALAVSMNAENDDFAIGENVLADVPPPAMELPELIEQAFSERLELRALGRSQEAVRRGIISERVNYFPRLDAVGEAIYANPNPRYFPPTEEWNGTWAVGASISWNLTGAIATMPRVKTLKAQSRELRAQYEQLRRGVELEVTQAFVDHKKARANLELAHTRRAAADAAYDATAIAFKVGTATATELITAQSELINAQLQAINARIDLRVATTRLAYATGTQQIPKTTSG